MVGLPPSDHRERSSIGATLPTIYGNMLRNAGDSVFIAISDAEAIDLVVVVVVVVGYIVGRIVI